MAAVSLFVTAQSPINPLSRAYPYSDSSIYLMVARTIDSGGMPYVDIFDHKGPILYIINFIGYSINHDWGLWILEYIGIFASVFFAYLTCRIYISRIESLFVVSIVFSGISAKGYWIGNTPESLSLPMLFCSIYWAIKYIDHRKISDLILFVTGVFFSAIFLMKPNISAPILIYVLFAIFRSFTVNNYRSVLRGVALFTLGTLTLLVSVLAWLYSRGAIEEFYNQYVLFNLHYANEEHSLSSIFSSYRYFLFSPVMLLCLCGLLVSLLLYRFIERKLLYDLFQCIVALTGLLWMVVYPGRNYQHYSLLFAPVFTISISIAVHSMRNVLSNRKIKIPIIVGAAVLIFITVIVPNAIQTVENISNYTSRDLSKEEVVEYIKNYDERDTSIAVISPDDCWIYLAANRESATTYAYPQVGIISGKTSPELLADYISQIEDNMPQLIITRSEQNWFENVISASIGLSYDAVYNRSGFTVYELREDGN